MSNENEQMLKDLYVYYANQHNSNETSLKDSVSKHAEQIKDAYSNSVLGIGGADHLAQFDDYDFENNTLNWFLWLALYNESWVFRRTIDKPSQDMIRPGISINGSLDYSKVYNQLQFMRSDLIDALKWMKLFGGSVLVLLFKGISFDDMKDPIDYNKIKGCEYIRSYVTDRWFGCSPSYGDTVSNLANEDFGKPKYYDIQFADGTSHKIHHSWVLRFENRGAPQLIKTGQLQGWGYAEGAHILRELNRDDKLKNSIQSLVDKSLIEIIKMPGMRGVFQGADKGNEAQLKKRLEMVNWGRNFNSLTFLDKDDEYQQHNFSGLNGLSDLLDLNMRQIAAAVEMPNVLYGDLSNGFTSDDQALERYDEKILNDDESYLRKPMQKLLKVLFKVYDVKDDEGKTPKPNFTFNSILAEKRNSRKMEEFKSLLELCNTMAESKLLSPEDEIATLQDYLDSGTFNIRLNSNKGELKKAVNEIAEGENEMDDLGDIDLGSNELRSSSPRRSSRPERSNRESSTSGLNEQGGSNETPESQATES